MHRILDFCPNQPGRNQMYQSERVAKVLLFYYIYCANRHRKKISKHKQEKILDDWLLNRVKGSEEWKKEEWKKRTRKRRGKKVGGSKYAKNKVHVYN